MKASTVSLFLLLLPLFCYAQKWRTNTYWYLNIDSLTSLRKQDSLYIKTSVRALSKDSNLIKASNLFDETFQSNWASFNTYLNAGTCIKIFDDIEDSFNLTSEEKSTILVGRGFCKYIYKKYHEAMVDLNNALKINPGSGYVFWFKGLCKQELSDYYGAIGDFSESIKVADNDKYLKVNAYVGIAESQEALKNYFAAINTYNTIIELEPSECSFYLKRGKLKIIESKKEKTSACLDLSKAGELGCEEAYSVIKKFCN